MLNPTNAHNEQEMNQIYEMMGRMGDKNKIQEICPRYMLGFCVYGPKCRLVHLKSVIIDEQTNLESLANICIERFIKNKHDRVKDINTKTSNNENDETQT